MRLRRVLARLLYPNERRGESESVFSFFFHRGSLKPKLEQNTTAGGFRSTTTEQKIFENFAEPAVYAGGSSLRKALSNLDSLSLSLSLSLQFVQLPPLLLYIKKVDCSGTDRSRQPASQPTNQLFSYTSGADEKFIEKVCTRMRRTSPGLKKLALSQFGLFVGAPLLTELSPHTHLLTPPSRRAAHATRRSQPSPRRWSTSPSRRRR